MTNKEAIYLLNNLRAFAEEDDDPAIDMAIKALSAERIGEWKRHPIHDNRAWDVCTACGIGCRRRRYGFNEDGTEWVEEVNYPFCPNCGAKMSMGGDTE